jgi:predicted AAA+ superfamily ATPase
MLSRPRHVERVVTLLRDFPVVAVLGARQVGKTTLAGQVADRLRGGVTRFDLESERDVARLSDAGLALGRLRGLVVLDEIQRRPELFPALRVLADRPRRPARFLVLGSASPALLRQSSETLAGRIAYHELEGLQLDEVGGRALDRRWLRGGFPRSFLARTDQASAAWRREFVRTFLERDAPALGIPAAAPTLRRLWSMLAHVHGHTLNLSDLARSLGISDMSVRRYVEGLAATFVVRLLSPWFENLGKRQVKAPKVYLTDSGILHALLQLETVDDLLGHPKVGASWEGFGLANVAARLGARPEECHFWGTHQGAELDLLVVRGRRRLGFEFKLSEAPAVTRSMRVALADLGLQRLDVVHAGADTFALGDRIRAVALQRVFEDIEPLR